VRCWYSFCAASTEFSSVRWKNCARSTSIFGFACKRASFGGGATPPCLAMTSPDIAATTTTIAAAVLITSAAAAIPAVAGAVAEAVAVVEATVQAVAAHLRILYPCTVAFCPTAHLRTKRLLLSSKKAHFEALLLLAAQLSLFLLRLLKKLPKLPKHG